MNAVAVIPSSPIVMSPRVFVEKVLGFKLSAVFVYRSSQNNDFVRSWLCPELERVAQRVNDFPRVQK